MLLATTATAAQVKPVVAHALPAHLPKPATLTDGSFPDGFKDGGFVNHADADYGYGDAAVWSKGDTGYDIWAGTAEPNLVMKSSSKNFLATVAAAAKLSKQRTEDAQSWGINDDDMAIGIFQAKDGSFYLTNLVWNSDGNDSGHSLSLYADQLVRRGNDQLQALVSDVAFADLRKAPVAK